jgi:hypothetical protein
VVGLYDMVILTYPRPGAMRRPIELVSRAGTHKGETMKIVEATVRAVTTRVRSAPEPEQVIPDSETYDIMDKLAVGEPFNFRTIDGLVFTIEETEHIIPSSNSVHGVRIIAAFDGIAVFNKEGCRCDRYLTAWKSFDPQRNGLYWKCSWPGDNKLPCRVSVAFVF